MRCSVRDDVPSTTCRAEGGTVGPVLAPVLALGALFGMMLSPCSRQPFVSVFVVVGVPFLTFLVAAPSRLGLGRELSLFVRDAHAMLLAAACALTGRRREAAAVVGVHRERVEAAYGGRLAAFVEQDPLRLHHARRLGVVAALLAVVAGVGLPFVAGDVYTFGEFPVAPFVFLTDLVVIGVVSRVVTERIAIRLFEAGVALAGDDAWVARARTVPLTAMLGAALGAVGSLVVLAAAAAASGVESRVVLDADVTRAAVWFLRQTAPMALPLGIGIGGILGVGMGLSQRR
jgi:hypothetical protein